MPTKEEHQRDKYFKEFGQHLVHQHRRIYDARRQRQSNAGDPAAERFGRYLRAARHNAALGPEELAAAAKISVATLQALEHGLWPVASIKAVWLKRLAATLNENAADFRLLLGLPDNPAKVRWPAIHWPRLFHAKSLSGPGFASVSAMLLWAVVGVALLIHTDGAGVPLSPTRVAAPVVSQVVVLPVDAPQPRSTLVPVDIEARLNLVKAERQKVVLQNIDIINFGDPLVVVPDYQVGVVYFAVPPEAAADDNLPVAYAFDLFYNPVLVLWALTSYTPDGRFNIANAEYGLENQVLVPRHLDAVNPDSRLNMVKAEILL